MGCLCFVGKKESGAGGSLSARDETPDAPCDQSVACFQGNLSHRERAAIQPM